MNLGGQRTGDVLRACVMRVSGAEGSKAHASKRPNTNARKIPCVSTPAWGGHVAIMTSRLFLQRDGSLPHGEPHEVDV